MDMNGINSNELIKKASSYQKAQNTDSNKEIVPQERLFETGYYDPQERLYRLDITTHCIPERELPPNKYIATGHDLIERLQQGDIIIRRDPIETGGDFIEGYGQELYPDDIASPKVGGNVTEKLQQMIESLTTTLMGLLEQLQGLLGGKKLSTVGSQPITPQEPTVGSTQGDVSPDERSQGIYYTDASGQKVKFEGEFTLENFEKQGFYIRKTDKYKELNVSTPAKLKEAIDSGKCYVLKDGKPCYLDIVGFEETEPTKLPTPVKKDVGELAEPIDSEITEFVKVSGNEVYIRPLAIPISIVDKEQKFTTKINIPEGIDPAVRDALLKEYNDAQKKIEDEYYSCSMVVCDNCKMQADKSSHEKINYYEKSIENYMKLQQSLAKSVVPALTVDDSFMKDIATAKAEYEKQQEQIEAEYEASKDNYFKKGNIYAEKTYKNLNAYLSKIQFPQYPILLTDKAYTDKQETTTTTTKTEPTEAIISVSVSASDDKKEEKSQELTKIAYQSAKAEYENQQKLIEAEYEKAINDDNLENDDVAFELYEQKTRQNLETYFKKMQ